MSQTPVFLRRETRVSTVVWSVICIITAIMLTLLALMLDNAKIAVVGSVVMALFLSFVHGITQLAVVRDYRAPHRYLSVDGILHICLTIVIALASVLYLVSQAILSAAESASSFDFRYVVAVFIFIVAAWQCCVAVIAFRGRHFNATLEALLALSYIASGIGVLGQSGFSDGAAADRFLLIADFVLCAVTLVYLLVSYVFRSPDYLVTEEGLQTLRREQELQAQCAARFAGFGVPQPSQTPYSATPAAPTSPDAAARSNVDGDITARLAKLKNLFEAGLISEAEYRAKRQELIDRL